MKGAIIKMGFLLFGFVLQSLPLFASNSTTLQDHFSQGEKLIADRNYRAAAKHFKSILEQRTPQTDSLLQARTYAKLGHCYAHINIDTSLIFFHTAYDWGTTLEDAQSIVEASSGLSEIYSIRGQKNKGLPYRWTTNKYNLIIQDWYNYSAGLSMLGNDYMNLGQLDSAQWYIEKGLQIKDSFKIDKNLYLNYNHLARLYENLNKTEKAIEFHLKCIKLLENKKDSSGMVLQFINISNLFRAQDNLERAEEYIKKALGYIDQLGLYYYKSIALYSSGDIRMAQKRPAEGLALYQEGLQISRKLKNKRYLVDGLIKIGNHYLAEEKYELAENIYAEAIPIIEERQVIHEIFSAHLAMTKVRVAQNKMDQAQSFLQQAEEVLQSITNHNSWFQFYHVKSWFLEQNGQYQQALAIGQQAMILEDSLFNIEKISRIHELEEQYERTNKEKEINLLNTENQLKDLILYENRKSTLFLLIGALLALAALPLLFYFYRLRQKTKVILEEKNGIISQALKDKDVLLKEIHNRVKNNLGIVSSLLDLQSQNINDPKALDALQEGQNRVKSMALIHQDLYQTTDKLPRIEVKEYIEKLSQSLFQSYNIDPERIQLQHQIEAFQLDVDTIIPIGLILNELITNALKYAFPQGSTGMVQVILKKEKDYLLLEVKDNGIGSRKDQELISSNEGFGFKLIKTFASKLKAQFEVLENNGITVRLLIHKYK